MTRFAKIFETPHGQLLATCDFNDEADYEREPYRLNMRGEDLYGVNPCIGYGYETKETRDSIFEEMDQEDADETAAALHGVVSSLMRKADDASDAVDGQGGE